MGYTAIGWSAIEIKMIPEMQLGLHVPTCTDPQLIAMPLVWFGGSQRKNLDLRPLTPGSEEIE